LGNPAEELKTAMMERLRASAEFSRALNGRIFSAEPREPPAAWIGATAHAGDGTIDLIATVHIRIAAAKETASALVDLAQAAFVDPPIADGISISSWRPEYREVRLDEEHSAYHGLARFRADAQVVPPLA
jgi:hypothetical protein